jgi:hypothetical protein
MRFSFFKGVALGAAVSVVTIAATAAFAGTGVGGVFNLGKTNTVDATTALSGTVRGAQLDVSNSATGKGATGIGIGVAQGKPPLVVNSTTKVKHLNADQLDGVDSTQLQRTTTGGCTFGRAIKQLLPDGTFTCSNSKIRALAHATGASSLSYDFVSDNVEVAYACDATYAYFKIMKDTPDAAVINWMYSNGTGSATTVNASGSSLGDSTSPQLFEISDRLEGQFIMSGPSTVTTINLHAYHAAGPYCEFYGTAESATIGAE